MQPRTKAVTAAVTGSALGLAGLAALAIPAGAGQQPELPDVSAEELVATTLADEPPAFAGEVRVESDLGLDMPGLSALEVESARVFYDGDERARVAVEGDTSDTTMVKTADEFWRYDSSSNEAVHATVDDSGRPAEHGADQHADVDLSDPASAASAIVDGLSETSTIAVDGTATVADRAAYELVLEPKPTERTVLREVRIAIDDETRTPLRLQVFGNGEPAPVASAEFTEFSPGAQADSLFEFTPPDGATVREADAAEEHAEADAAATDVIESLAASGKGWDTVVTGTVPEDLLSAGAGQRDADHEIDTAALLAELGDPVDGDFGSGQLITTRAGSVIVTDDGRFAAGAVPQQVLVEELNRQ